MKISRALCVLAGLGLLGVAPAYASLPPGWVAKTTTEKGLKKNDSRSAYARCASGEVVTGGGYEMNQADRDLVILLSGPAAGNPAGWLIKFKNTGAVERDVTVDVYVGCAAATMPPPPPLK